ncbi:MAG: hypothetical protein ACP5Q5_03570 [Brevinematia bacterium]
MKNVFLKFSIGRTFIVKKELDSKNGNIPYILLFERDKLTKYFEISEKNLETYKAFYLAPRPIGIEVITKSWNYFNVILLDNEEIQNIFIQKICPKIGEISLPDFLILTEEAPQPDSMIIEINKKFCSVFYIEVNKTLVPVTYAPFNYTHLPLDSEVKKTILSFGNEKNFTMSVLKNNEITISPNFGELSNLYELDALEFLIKSIVSNEKNNITYLQEEDSYSIINNLPIRHHNQKNIFTVNHIESHFVNLLYDNNIKEKIIGIIYDSISYDTKDEIAGSNIVLGDINNFQAIGKWKPLPLPGGDIANIEPWRIALGALKELLKSDLESLELPIIKSVKDNPHYSYLFDAINKNVISYSLSSSMHHIIAAIGEILFFEGSVKNFDFFEMMVDETIKSEINEYYDLPIMKEEEIYLIDTYELIRNVLKDVFEQKDRRLIFGIALKSILLNTIKLLKTISKEHSIDKIGISGELFKHPNILQTTIKTLEKEGFNVILPKHIPLDDSAISVGQIIAFLHQA